MADKLTCDLCLEEVSSDQALVFGTATVCASCKPRYVQMLREGRIVLPKQLSRYEDIVILPKGQHLPHRCVVCNGEEYRRLTRLFVLEPLAHFDWPVRLRFSRCQRHQREWQTVRRIAWLLGATSLLLLIVHLAVTQVPVFGIVFTLLLILVIVTTVTLVTHRPDFRRCTERTIQVGGCGQAFLNSLPERSDWKDEQSV